MVWAVPQGYEASEKGLLQSILVTICFFCLIFSGITLFRKMHPKLPVFLLFLCTLSNLAVRNCLVLALRAAKGLASTAPQAHDDADEASRRQVARYYRHDMPSKSGFRAAQGFIIAARCSVVEIVVVGRGGQEIWCLFASFQFTGKGGNSVSGLHQWD